MRLAGPLTLSSWVNCLGNTKLLMAVFSPEHKLGPKIVKFDLNFDLQQRGADELGISFQQTLKAAQ